MPVEESHENDEDDLASLTWQEIAERRRNIGTFESVIEELMVVEPDNEEDRLPDQLSEVANTIYHISSGIKSVRSHKEDFERLLGHASSLVVVFWESYNKLGIPGTMWPPPYLRKVIDRLVDTVYFIYKLMKRKSKKGFTKRTLVGYFGLRDLGKFKKYQRKLGYVASGFENEPNNVNINEVLLEIIRNRAQHLVSVPAGTETTADRSRLHKKAKQNEVEDGERIENSKLETAPMKTTRRQSDSKGTRETNFDEKSESNGKRTNRTDEDVGEGTSKRTNNAQSKTRKKVEQKPAVSPQAQSSISGFPFVEGSTSSLRRGSQKNNATQPESKRVSSVYDDKEYDRETPVVDSVASKPKKKKNLKPSSPLPPPVSPQSTISGFNFTNNSGYMSNQNIGNIYNSTISDAYNDNSVNTFNGRRKPA